MTRFLNDVLRALSGDWSRGAAQPPGTTPDGIVVTLQPDQLVSLTRGHAVRIDIPADRESMAVAVIVRPPKRLAGEAVKVINMVRAEWDEAVQQSLDKLGLTYEQLAEMARSGDFSSVEAQKLWVSIGGQTGDS